MMTAVSPPPRLTEGCDLRSLPIGPSEAFLLSRVDGILSPTELAHATGMDVGQVTTLLAKLEALGAVFFRPPPGDADARADTASEVRLRPDAAPRSSVPPTGGRTSSPPPDWEAQQQDVGSDEARQASSEPAASSQAAASSEPPASVRPPRARVLNYDPALLDEETDLPEETKHEILEVFSLLDDANHYTMLGVERTAEKKDIKAAYFVLVQQFHADRFFGKKLGTFKGRIDRIFAALTKAHDTLARNRSRAQYDAYLKSREETLGARDSVAPRRIMQARRGAGQVNSLKDRARPGTDVADSYAAQIPAAPRTPFLDSDEPERITLNPDRESSTPPGVPSGRLIDKDAARRMMARKLKGQFQVATQPSQRPSSIPPVSKEDLKRAVRDDLKVRYDNRQSIPAVGPKKWLKLGKEAASAGQWASAVNALKMALELDPDDAEATALLETAQFETDKQLADKFSEQAKYEEREREYERAATSYERAARGKRSATLYASAAECARRAKFDSRKVVELARSATLIRPEAVAYQILLAKAYSEAQMGTSALAAIKRALELDSKNDEAKALYKEFKKLQ